MLWLRTLSMAIAIFAWPATVVAQDPAPPITAAATCDCIAVPPLLPITVEILNDLGSKTSKSGDSFPIRLAEPIIVADKDVIPAGTMGVGEVVHAKKAASMGSPGELVLAARYLDIDGRRLRLRSLQLNPKGKSAIGAVSTMVVASTASPLPIALLGFFVTGGQITVPRGTVAQAKTAESFNAPAPAAKPAQAVPATFPLQE